MIKVTMICTAFRATNSLLENWKANEELKDFLKKANLHPVECVGSYKEDGQDEHKQELSFMVQVNNDQYRELTMYITGMFEQDSVLVIDTDTNAYLMASNSVTGIGKFTITDEKTALKSGAFTYLKGSYYITVQ